MKVKVFFCVFFTLIYCCKLYSQANTSGAVSTQAYEQAYLANTNEQERSEDYNSIQRAFTIYAEANFAFLDADYEKAVLLYTESIDINPTVKSYYNRALSYSHIAKTSITKSEKTSLYNKSIDDYTAAIKLSPNDASIYNNRAVIYIQLADVEKAKLDFANAKRLAANDPDIQNNINKFNYENQSDL